MPTNKTFKNEPMDWAVADRLVQNIHSILNGRADMLFFGGSYIRESAKVGDIDLAILANDNTPKALEDLWTYAGQMKLTNGNVQKRWVLRFDEPLFQLDIWIVSLIKSWGPLCMFVAGNGVLNIKQRQLATKAGYVLSQYAVTKDGASCGEFPSEISVYNFFHWPWIPYSKRTVSF